MKKSPTTNSELRARRRERVRAKIIGTAVRPRLAVYRSNRFVSAQLIDDTAGKTIVAAHGREFKGPQSMQATSVGEAIAKKAKAFGITSIVFDRGGYRYGGQVKALADAARAGGLIF
ncbi:50S ribosomal protein L18 [Candidatus Kaiserbacteria bacterium CG_4_9_14_3_um_filter_50_16]|uniref:Large ribosomal subunit protein uL18 n=2 Tax=Candidatus Kaiseribacteriota TaxID=1752734 RepID=A0A2M7FCJ5_9BACT|nr:MAG: 50S ribosomal protein L18 [Parcubacteria group bacterium CG1_02_50_68]PIS43624.1 MAG: 50S ribosomal protein L18 [Candidatus Kaiserbacteria bacterium CG08_land_8_20_14_0_20_50_21]PIU81853.1 MAG: 50S ribosomal protein L18 [Candidatus Kaiserbacteria bacterium CG06_land_8_20_14_3_00_49_31]PIV87199.1 MAG: 50S ribosomal protein L18 [Candidatus Kaiserbacteria bacterium CG17_big_fil_post_rev_8_21_14_2_50_51_7]PIW96302.1 MAG: 50S ribosomal protein L18 [Candidatus Kaiserbacteria bacterium CG_4_8_